MRNNEFIQAVVMDFDGTFSTLRFGWEATMRKVMLSILGEGCKVTPEIESEVDSYISESTGIQTIMQMKWLAGAVERHCGKAAVRDIWEYKEAYNRLLMETVEQRKMDVAEGRTPAAKYLIEGALCFLGALKRRGVALYLASGTDESDVRKEADILGVSSFFDGIHGAQVHSEACMKTKVMEELVKTSGIAPERIAIIGDGPVEIALGRKLGTRTIGIASDEAARCGINPVKKKRLENAGAEYITGDFKDVPAMLSYLGFEGNPTLDFSGIKTYSATGRTNLVTIEGLLKPGVSPVPEWDCEGFSELVDRIALARKNARPVMLSMGAHVIKNNLSLYLIELMKQGIVTHLSGNGACSIHDFELAYLGGTSEHVPTAIEDGSFGMWEETGRWMNEAIQQGVAEGFGYGESLARYIHRNPEKFPHRDCCVLYQAWLCGVPATYHIALGTDIIHQHPICDFGALGAATGRDFHTYCQSISQLDGGVFLNFGSGVIGPEVFLKALSISRNLGYQTFHITTGNFDLIDLGDFRCKIGYDDPNYYYRPRKNIVNRPVSCGGKGWHFRGDHKQTIPNLYKALKEKGCLC